MKYLILLNKRLKKQTNSHLNAVDLHHVPAGDDHPGHVSAQVQGVRGRVLDLDLHCAHHLDTVGNVFPEIKGH